MVLSEFILLVFIWTSVEGHVERKPTLILISFDGFRYDYLQRVKTTRLAWLQENGVSATVINNFVTRTFPNHVSIVTGRYEEKHGIIDNIMWDPVYKEKFTYTTVDPKWYNISEPIWVANERQGVGRLSAVVNWVGGAVPFHGYRAFFSPPYNQRIPFRTLVDMVLRQLDNDPPVNFVALHFHEPDSTGHKYGPNSKQVDNAILNLDQVIEYFVQELKKRHLFDEVNMILTSDHGMADVSPKRYVYLDDYISPDSYTLVDSGINAYIIPHKNETQDIYNNLTKAPHVTVFYKEDIPGYWHYANNRRVTPIFVASDLGYRIIKNATYNNMERGSHGYNNSIKEMHPFFIAYGPAFKQGYQSKPFSIVNIYSLMCHLLDITPRPNDGNLAAVSHLLREESNNVILYIIAMIFSGLILIIMIYGLIANYRKRTYRFSRVPVVDVYW